MVTKKIAKRGRPKRGRPRGFDVDQALAIALALFHERGYDGVGVAELSKSIGITAPSLYSAFGSKRDLFERVLARYVQLNGCWLPAALMAKDTLAASISNLFTEAAKTYAADPECPGCLVIDGTRNCTDAGARLLTAEFRQATRQIIRDRITAKASDLTNAEADTLANYALMVLVGLSGSARDGMTLDDLQSTAEIAAAGFVQKLSQLPD